MIVACNVDVQHGSEGWPERVRRVYDRVAGRYDLAALGFRLLGFRYDAYLRRAAETLAVRPGQTVVDLGCGTGKNLPALAEAVGPGGRVVGVDISAAMLERARARVAPQGLRNVELVEADAATFGLPPGTERVLATFSLSMMADPERVIEHVVGALPPHGRFAVLDFRIPPSWSGSFRQAALALTAPLGETRAMAERDLRPLLRRHVTIDTDVTVYFGAGYLAAGTPGSRSRAAPAAG
ncbi:class I SAM-dependent methyltransferase [soil metagenome]